MEPHEKRPRRGGLVALIIGLTATLALSVAVWAMWPTVAHLLSSLTAVVPPEDDRTSSTTGSTHTTTTISSTSTVTSSSDTTCVTSTTASQTVMTTVTTRPQTTPKKTTTTKRVTTTTKTVTKPTVRPTIPTVPPDDEPADKIVNLGNPQRTNRAPINARNPWDMIVVGDSLYVGGGDYGIDSGPTIIWRYDITDKRWQASSVVQDEAVQKFVTVDGTVLAPGTDPTTNTWSLGNYHQLVGEQWQTIDNLPDAVHNYDIISFGGRTFFAIGTFQSSTSPVKVTTDRQTYTDVPFYVDGVNILKKPLGDYYRAVEFFVANDALYCAVYSAGENTRFWGFFRYRDGAFHFVSKVADHGLAYGNFWTDAFGPTVTLNGTCYFTTKKLYKTTDFETVRQVDTPDNGIVTDLLIETGGIFQTQTMYVLTAVEQADGTYRNTIWRYIETDRFSEVATFDTAVSAFSFAKHQNTFFVGLGHQGSTHEDTGTILQIRI